MKKIRNIQNVNCITNLLFLFDDYIDIYCHACLCKIKLDNILYKQILKKNKYYYCSKQCYNFF